MMRPHCDHQLTEQQKGRPHCDPLTPGDGVDAVHPYTIFPPDKLLRPRLVVHAALAVGAELRALLPAAAGIKGTHVGSLMHDDVIDFRNPGH
ncbi:hypothetical protein QBC98_007864 [Kitasatospora acidiphila]